MRPSLKMWFDPTESTERRKQRNRLKRIAVDSERQDESQIERWLELADAALATPPYDPEVLQDKRRPVRVA